MHKKEPLSPKNPCTFHQEKMYRRSLKQLEFEDIVDAVSNKLSIRSQEIVGPSKERIVVKARSLVCYWAVRELGHFMIEISQRLDIALSTVSAAVKKGRRIVEDGGLDLTKMLNVEM
jgi:chromosomal replication initiation ATPase DnaA